MNRILAKAILAGSGMFLAIVPDAQTTSEAIVMYRTIAVTGQQAPGAEPGVTFFGQLEPDFGAAPGIDAAGNVAFAPFLAGPDVSVNDQGIWLQQAGTLTKILRKGDPAPGMPGFTFATSGFVPLRPLLASGRIAVRAAVTDGSTPSGGIWSDASGALSLVVRAGQQAPGLPSGIAMGVGFPIFNSNGHVVFGSFLSGTGVTLDNDESIWSNRTGSLALVVREGSAAPGANAVFGASSSMFAPGGLRTFTFNSQSRIALHGNLAGPGIDDLNDEGIWAEGPGGLRLIARESEHAPGFPSDVHFGSSNGIDAFESPVPIHLGSTGAVLFNARVSGDDVNATSADTLWTDRTGSLELIVKGRTVGAAPEGDPAPGFPPGTSFTGFTNFALLNGSNRVAFVGVVEGSFVNGNIFDFGVFSDRFGSIQLVAGDGMPVPDLGPGVVFGTPASLSNTYALVGFTDAGSVAFITQVSGQVPDGTIGLFLSDPTGALRTVIHTGAPFDLFADGRDVRTVIDILPGNMNADGTLVFKLLFADGTVAVATASLGTPPCTVDAECNDGVFCNGVETCSSGACLAGSTPCPGLRCRESDGACVSCLNDSDCSDGLFCNGTEICDASGLCQPGAAPCDPSEFDSCDEPSDACVGGAELWVSFKGPTLVPGVGTVADEDIVALNLQSLTWSLKFDGSDVGLSGLAVDGLAVLPSGDLLLSFTTPGDVPGLIGGPSGTSVDDSDVVRFIPTSLGASTAGVFMFAFDGSDVGLSSDSEDVDAILVTADGRLVVSTIGPASTGTITAADEDLLIFTHTSLGASTAGSFAVLFDGSDVGLTTSGEDVDAAASTPRGLLLSTEGDFTVPGASGADEDVLEFLPTSLGPTTRGGFDLFLIMTAVGLSAEADVGGLELVE